MTVLFTLPGQVPVYLYSLLLGAAAAFGLGRAAQALGSGDSRAALLAGWTVLAAALVGARAGYVLANLPFFLENSLEILRPPLGGLSWAGAFGGGLLGLAVGSFLAGRPVGQLLNALFPLFAAVGLAAWLGCWLDGCAYGALSDAAYALPARDEWGNLDPRVPVQLAGALLSLLSLLVFDLLSRSRRSERAGLMSLVFFCLTLVALHAFRADPAPTWVGFRLDLAASAVYLVLSLLALALSGTRRTGNPVESSPQPHERTRP